VTQWEIVGATPQISEYWLIPPKQLLERAARSIELRWSIL
jgi:hypothetical protein